MKQTGSGTKGSGVRRFRERGTQAVLKVMHEASRIWGNVRAFLTRDVWEKNPRDCPFIQATLLRGLRITILTWRGIFSDELTLRASALTYITLISLIPMLIVGLSLARSFGFGDETIQNLMDMMSDMPEQVQEFFSDMLEQVQQTTRFSSLGWLGVAPLIITATMVLSSTESMFNRIWGISKSRNVIRRTSNYISLLVVVPFLMGIGSTIAVQLQDEAVVRSLGAIAPIYGYLLKKIPLITVWAGFSFLYIVLPNVRVRFVPALVGGLVASTLWVVWQRLYIQLQVGVVRYNVLYGTFAFLPIFLFWLYVGWIILLLGSEIAFAMQNHNTIHMERHAQKAGARARQLLALSVLCDAARALKGEGAAVATSWYSEEKRVPVRLLNEVMGQLEEGGYMAPVSDTAGDGRYVLIRAPENIAVKDILDLIEKGGTDLRNLGLGQVGQSLLATMDRLDRSAAETLEGVTVLTLITADGKDEPSGVTGNGKHTENRKTT